MRVFDILVGLTFMDHPVYGWSI